MFSTKCLYAARPLKWIGWKNDNLLATVHSESIPHSKSFWIRPMSPQYTHQSSTVVSRQCIQEITENQTINLETGVQTALHLRPLTHFASQFFYLFPSHTNIKRTVISYKTVMVKVKERNHSLPRELWHTVVSQGVPIGAIVVIPCGHKELQLHKPENFKVHLVGGRTTVWLTTHCVWKASLGESNHQLTETSTRVPEAFHQALDRCSTVC